MKKIYNKLTKKQKKVIFNIVLLLLIFVVTSIISIALLSMFGIIYIDDGLQFNVHLFEQFKNSWYGWIILILFQTILTVLLCVIPGTSMAFILLFSTLLNNPWQAFILSFISVLISSTFMYMLGRYGGYRICEKIMGKEDCEKSIKLLRTKSSIYFPLMMLFPAFPDDALVMIAGTLKMKLKWFIPSIIIGRGVGIITIIFGLKIIPFESFTTFYDWIIFFTLCLFWIFVIFNLAHKLNEKIDKANQKKEEKLKENQTE